MHKFNRNVISKGPVKILTDTFQSWLALVDFTDDDTQKTHPISGCTSKDEERGGGWFYSENWEKCLPLARAGWREKVADIDNASAKIFRDISRHIIRETYQYAEQGIVFDVVEALDGNPECWLEEIETQVEGRSNDNVHLVFNGTVSSGITCETILAKGTTVVTLINALEFAGKRVRVTLAHCVSGGKTKAQALVMLKDFDQPLDLARLLFAIAHPSCLRRLYFAISETYPAEFLSALNIGGSYGHPSAIEPNLMGDVYIDKSYWEKVPNTPTEKIQWVLAELARQGVALRGVK